MMDAVELFLIAAMALLLGFVADMMFRKYKSPDVLVLILFGLLLGLSGAVSPEVAKEFTELTPLVAGLALAVIMLHAGMTLQLSEVFRAFKRALVQSVLSFVASTVIVTAVCVYSLGWDLLTSLLLGSMLGGTSAAVVIPLLNGINASPGAKTIITLESAVTDVLMIVTAMTVMGILMDGRADAGGIAFTLASAFLVAGALGLAAGMGWLKIMHHLGDQKFTYMATFGVMLGLYAVAEIVLDGNGGGALSALVFGLTLANGEQLATMVRRGHKAHQFTCGESIHSLHDEITFFVRTFFFTYLGIIVTTITLTPMHIAAGAVISIAILCGRFVITRHVSSRMVETKGDRMAILFMMPRGLIAAVLASLALASGAVGAEMGEAVMGTATVVILATTTIASVGTLITHNQLEREAAQKRDADVAPSDQ